MQDNAALNVNNVSGLLKAFVILGGVMLVIGMILLAVMIVIRATSDDGEGPQRGLVSAEPVDLALPQGVRVEQVVVDGKRLVLMGEGADGQQYIAVVDADSGERKMLIRVTPNE